MRVIVALIGAALTGCSATSREVTGPNSKFSVDPSYPYILNVKYGEEDRSILYFPSHSQKSKEINIFVLSPVISYQYYPDIKKFTYTLTYRHLPNTETVNDWTESWRVNWNIENFIILTLPGIFGSDGATYEHGSVESTESLNDAVSQLKQIYGSDRVNIAAVSTSGTTVSALLTKRQDIKNMILGSTMFNEKEYLKDKQWPATYLGVKNPYSPIDHVEEIKSDRHRNILVISDPIDRVVPNIYSRQFVQKLKDKNIKVTLEEVKINTKDHHETGPWVITRLMQSAMKE
ncbi:MAG: alpha/beta hydrolase family protein [Phenylobacterium sp.]